VPRTPALRTLYHAKGIGAQPARTIIAVSLAGGIG
jgi:hypothetical protein